MISTTLHFNEKLNKATADGYYQSKLSITANNNFTNWNCSTLSATAFIYGKISILSGKFIPKNSGATQSLFGIPVTPYQLYDAFIGYALEFDTKAVIALNFTSTYNLIRNISNITSGKEYWFYIPILIS